MRVRSSLPVALRFPWGVTALGLLACSTPGATRIVGPDGSAMAHVHCGADQGACFRLAGELCPTGYEMRPVLRSNDGNFLIRCRAVLATAAAPVCEPAAPSVALTAAAPRGGSTHNAGATHPQSWPPSSEPWPSAYPWPPPETSAVVAPVAPDKPRTEPWDPGF